MNARLAALTVLLLGFPAAARGAAYVATGHQGSVATIARSPDGGLLATGGDDGRIKLWRTNELREERTLASHMGRVTQLRFSPDGKRLAAAGERGVSLWELPSGRLLWSFVPSWAALTVTFDETGGRVFTGGFGRVDARDAATGTALARFDVSGDQLLRFVMVGGGVVAGVTAGELWRWDARDGRVLSTTKVSLDSPMAATPDGRVVALVTNDGQLLLWKPTSDPEARPVPAPPRGSVTALDVSRNGKSLVVARVGQGDDRSIDVLSLEGRLSAQVKDIGDVEALSLDRDGRAVVWASAGAGTNPGSWLCEGDLAGGASRCQHPEGPARSLAFLFDGSLAVGADGEGVRVWTPGDPTEVRKLNPKFWPAAIGELAVSPDGKVVAYATTSVVLAYRADTGGRTELIADDQARYQGIAFSSDGKTLATSNRQALVLFDLDGGKRVVPKALDPFGTNLIRFSPDGRVVAAAARRQVKLWDAATGRLGDRFEDATALVRAFTFRPGGSQLAVGLSDGRVVLWEPQAGSSSRTLVGAGGAISSLLYAPDGKRLIVGSVDGRVRVVELGGGRIVRTLEEPTGSALGLAFVPGTSLLASADDDALVRIWDLERGRCLAELHGLDPHAWVVVAADGRLETPMALTPPSLHPLGVGPDVPASRALAEFKRSGLLRQLFAGRAGEPTPNARALERVPQTGHHKPISGLAFSPDGHLLASASSDASAGGVILWDARTGQQLRTVTTAGTQSLRFSPDGKSLVTADQGTLHFWEPASGKELVHFKDSNLPWTFGGPFAFVGGNDRIATVWEGGGVWDLTSGARLSQSFVQEFLSPPLGMTSDGRLVASAAQNGDVRLWQAPDLKPSRTLKGHRTFLFALAFSPDGQTLASGDADGLVLLWSTTDGRRLATLRPTPFSPGPIYSLAFSPDGRRLAAGTVEKDVVTWDLSKGNEVRRFAGRSGRLDAIAFTPDGSRIAAGGLGREIEIWDVETGALIDSLAGHAREISALAVSPGGPLVAFTANGGLRVWDAATGRESRALGGTGDWFGSLAFSADGTKLAAAGSRVASMFDVGSGAELSRWDLPPSVELISLSPDGGTAVTAAGSLDAYTISTWDTTSGQRGLSLGTVKGSPRAMAMSPSGRRVAVSADASGVAVWDTKSGKRVGDLAAAPNQIVSGLAFLSEDLLAVGDYVPAAIRLVDLKSGKPVRTLSGLAGSLTALALSRDAKLLVSADTKGTLVVWDPATGATVRTISGLPATAKTLAFTHDGRRVVAASADGLARFWDVGSGQLVGTFMAVGNTDFILAGAGNEYAASRGAHSGMAFRIGAEAYPFEQFDLTLNRPDRVLGALGYAPQAVVGLYAAARKRRLESLNVDEARLSLEAHAPAVALVGARPAATTKERKVRIRFSAQDPRALLSRLNVLVNGVPVYGADGFDVRARNTHALTHDVEVALSNGRNRIQLSATNELGVESLRTTFQTSYIGPRVRPNLYVIAVGVSSYRDKNANLDYAAKDAGDIAAAFGQGRDFGKVDVERILDADATRERILGVRRRLMKADVNDQVILFFAGHGVLDEKLNYYFGTSDMDFGNPAERGLAYSEIEKVLDGIPPRQKLLMMDTCHAGEVYRTPRQARRAPGDGETVRVRGLRGWVVSDTPALARDSPAALVREVFADLRRATGAHVIAAAGGAEVSVESGDWKNGVFTYSVLEGWRGRAADRNKDGALAVSEIRDFVTEKVRMRTANRQVPNARRENLESDFDLTPDAPHAKPWEYDGCPGETVGSQRVYRCGALVAILTSLPALSPKAALDDVLADLKRSLPAEVSLKVEPTSLAVAKKERSAVRLTGRRPNVFEPVSRGTLVSLTDKAGHTVVVTCIAADGVPEVLERCERGFGVIAEADAPREWPP